MAMDTAHFEITSSSSYHFKLFSEYSSTNIIDADLTLSAGRREACD